MGVKVDFDYNQWITRYPEFAGSVLQPQAQAYFDEAGLYQDNTGVGLPQDATQQRMLLYMLTAHIAARYAILNGNAPSGLVGRLSSASEGSVSVSVDASVEPGSEAWYAQTRYGWDYWNATRQYRSFRYRPGYPRPVDPFQKGLWPWGGY